MNHESTNKDKLLLATECSAVCSDHDSKYKNMTYCEHHKCKIDNRYGGVLIVFGED